MDFTVSLSRSIKHSYIWNYEKQKNNLLQIIKLQMKRILRRKTFLYEVLYLKIVNDYEWDSLELTEQL